MTAEITPASSRTRGFYVKRKTPGFESREQRNEAIRAEYRVRRDNHQTPDEAINDIYTKKKYKKSNGKHLKRSSIYDIVTNSKILRSGKSRDESRQCT